jgi:hypothetical protein
MMRSTRRYVAGGFTGALVTTGLPLLALAASEVHPDERASYLHSSDGGERFYVEQLDDVHLGVNIVHAEAENGTVHGLFSDSTDFPETLGFPGPAGIDYRRSVDGGRRFADSVRLDDAGGQSSESDLAVEDRTVHVVWEEMVVDGTPEEVLYTRSDDGGRSFAPPVDVSESPGLAETDPDIAVDGDLVVLAWEGRAVPTNAAITKNRDIFVRISHDGGRTFDAPLDLTFHLPGNSVVDDEPAVAVSGDTVVIVFRRGGGNGQTFWLRSTDGGVTWDGPDGDADPDVAQLPGAETADNTPAISMDGSRVHVLACDKDDGGVHPDDDDELVHWRSTDGGATFADGVAIDDQPCSKAAIDGVGEILHAVAETDVALGSDIFHARSGDAGSTWSPFRNLSVNFGGSTDPSVSVDPRDARDVHVAWKDETEFLFALAPRQRLALEQGAARHFDDEDVIRFSGGVFEMVLDGSDVGLAHLQIDALAVIQDPVVPSTYPLAVDNSRFVLSFSEAGNVPGIGWVDDSDLVLFTPTSLGDDTAGTFSLYFDGSDVGLTGSGEDIDAVDIDGGDLYLSTSGSFSTGVLDGAREDVFVCQGASVGSDSACARQAIAFDGSALGLTAGSEDVDAFSFFQDDTLASPPAFFSTRGSYSTPSATGTRSDLFACGFSASFATECGGPSAPLATTFSAETYGIDGNLTAIEFENRKIEEP